MDVTASDAELIARARGGDDDAFRSLVRRHEGVVSAIVIRMLGPGDEADDVGQETFVRFFNALGSFRGDAAVRTYLVRIAMNLSLNALRRRRWQMARFMRHDSAPASAVALPARGGEAAVEDAERRGRVRQALAALDDKHRAVVVLRFFDERSTRETAQLLGIPEGTVMSRLKRALERLRSLLQGLEEA